MSDQIKGDVFADRVRKSIDENDTSKLHMLISNLKTSDLLTNRDFAADLRRLNEKLVSNGTIPDCQIVDENGQLTSR